MKSARGVVAASARWAAEESRSAVRDAAAVDTEANGGRRRGRPRRQGAPRSGVDWRGRPRRRPPFASVSTAAASRTADLDSSAAQRARAATARDVQDIDRWSGRPERLDSHGSLTLLAVMARDARAPWTSTSIGTDRFENRWLAHSAVDPCRKTIGKNRARRRLSLLELEMPPKSSYIPYATRPSRLSLGISELAAFFRPPPIRWARPTPVALAVYITPWSCPRVDVSLVFLSVS